MSIKIFIVDDHPLVIEGIKALLQQERTLEWLGHATTADGCMASLRMQQPDVLFMDINLPDRSGIELCREVLQLYPSIAVIGLSTYNQQSYVRKMTDNGALAYVLKNATGPELMQAIEKVTKGKRYLSHEVSLALRKDPVPGAPVLTRREKEVLALIAGGSTSSEIAEKLFVSITTIHTHRKSLLAKFNLNNTAAMVKAALDYKLIDTSDAGSMG